MNTHERGSETNIQCGKQWRISSTEETLDVENCKKFLQQAAEETVDKKMIQRNKREYTGIWFNERVKVRPKTRKNFF